MKKVTDEMLMALADGELDRDTAADVARAVEADPELAQRLEDLRRTRMLAKQAYADVLEAKVPPRLVAAAGGIRRSRRAPWSWPAWRGWFVGGLAGAAAAAIVLTLVRPGGEPTASPLPNGGEIAAALDAGVSGETMSLGGGRSVELTATYVTEDGVCRSFRTSGVGDEAWFAVACRHDGSWHVAIAAAESGGNFTPASDAATSGVDAYLDTVGAGEGLDESEESRLRDNGWNQ